MNGPGLSKKSIGSVISKLLIMIKKVYIYIKSIYLKNAFIKLGYILVKIYQ